MREFLLQKDVHLTIRDFFANPFDKEELHKLLGENSPKDILATRSPSIKSLGLDLSTISDESLIEGMLKEPKLIKRPIVVINGVRVPGATEKSLLGLLDE